METSARSFRQYRCQGPLDRRRDRSNLSKQGEGRERLLGVAIGFAAVTVLVVTLFLAAQSGTLWLLVTALLPLALIVLAAYLIFRTLWRRR